MIKTYISNVHSVPITVESCINGFNKGIYIKVIKLDDYLNKWKCPNKY